ncbi:MAG: hypothetical protein V9G25_04785 [Acidimicrobiia bacterium]
MIKTRRLLEEMTGKDEIKDSEAAILKFLCNNIKLFSPNNRDRGPVDACCFAAKWNSILGNIQLRNLFEGSPNGLDLRELCFVLSNINYEIFNNETLGSKEFPTKRPGMDVLYWAHIDRIVPAVLQVAIKYADELTIRRSKSFADSNLVSSAYRLINKVDEAIKQGVLPEDILTRNTQCLSREEANRVFLLSDPQIQIIVDSLDQDSDRLPKTNGVDASVIDATQTRPIANGAPGPTDRNTGHTING